MSRKEKRNKISNNQSRIASHRQVGNKLVAPFNQIPNASYISWMNDRLPCMLWAALLIKGIGRECAIEVFRKVGRYVGHAFRGEEDRGCKLPRVGLHGLSTLDSDLQDCFFDILFAEEGAVGALKPLELLDNLPLQERWREKLGVVSNNQKELWTQLAEAVLALLDHQSQESTDCRWAYILPIVNSGRLHLQNEEQFRELTEYPYYGEQTKVRPFIRATEMQFGNEFMKDGYVAEKSKWSKKFWDECKKKTECFAPLPKPPAANYDLPKTISEIRKIWYQLVEHFVGSDEYTHVQPKRDASFGFCFYAMTLTQEGLASSGKFLTAKLALRMLAELYITFSYLNCVGDSKIWNVYRAYGAGQAKLTFLKLEEILEDQPGYLNKESVEALANEDMYMDFQDIDLGNWANIDLRKMSQVAGCKDVYDAYYSWPSSYAHGQWCAVRDVVFTTCQNPLHRLHRIPRSAPRYEDGAEGDLILLLNKILDLLNVIYPGFTIRAKLIPTT